MSNKNALVLLADSHYLEHTKVVFYTAVKFGNWKGDCVLLAYEIDDSVSLEWFKERDIKIVSVNRETFDFTSIEKEKFVYFAKLYLFHPFWNNYDKLIYLDTDVIVRKDINPLLKYKDFAAAHDCFQYTLIHQFSPPGKPYKDAFINNHFPRKVLRKISFNTGVMVIQSKKNTIEQYRELINLTNSYGSHSVFYDQGVINLHFIQKRQRIPYVFNDYYASEFHGKGGFIKRKNDRDAVILHIIHPFKPWNENCIYHNEWKSHYQQSLKELRPQAKPIKASLFSIYKVDLISRLRIVEIYTRGSLAKTVGYASWRTGQYFRKALSVFYKNENKS
ncbi:MAG: hypothetical protein EA412_11150 [Chitinophagaceae bacterium]|nr:MAG: hypothetical protein EA412_11150 [Chitinophagaceae bacterium]